MPLIIFDPYVRADATLGTVSDALVEGIDLAPTFVDEAGGDSTKLDHVLEAQSLLPMIRGDAAPRRDYCICEFDFSASLTCDRLSIDPKDGRMFMAADRTWKMIHFERSHRPMLFNLENDPGELVDLGAATWSLQDRGDCPWTAQNFHKNPRSRGVQSDLTGGRVRSRASARAGFLPDVQAALRAFTACAGLVGDCGLDRSPRKLMYVF